MLHHPGPEFDDWIFNRHITTATSPLNNPLTARPATHANSLSKIKKKIRQANTQLTHSNLFSPQTAEPQNSTVALRTPFSPVIMHPHCRSQHIGEQQRGRRERAPEFEKEEQYMPQSGSKKWVNTARNEESIQQHKLIAITRIPGLRDRKQEDKGRVKLLQSPQQFLKALRIRSNINLYKGNFVRLGKETSKEKRGLLGYHINSDVELSPWEIGQRGGPFMV